MNPLQKLLEDDRVAAFDRSVDRAAGRLRGNPIVDRAMYALSEAANHSILWHTVNALDAAVGGRSHRRRALRRSVILATEQAFVNGALKSCFRRDRPVVLTAAPHRLRTPKTTSFPSGHASAGACAATLMSTDLGATPLWWAAAAAVSWSRIHVGVHHGSDVVGGLVIGRLLATAAQSLWPPSSHRTN